ncbi:hypothetical protein [Pandoravirus japonicus]|uniref:Transmembrane protein n=1 Tax=Pandoravirus japonicus TaxID=2823154 RepID=A0A811BQV9_9VIRU|nr:hypothetical protein [Pandoravirus japonicus]
MCNGATRPAKGRRHTQVSARKKVCPLFFFECADAEGGRLPLVVFLRGLCLDCGLFFPLSCFFEICRAATSRTRGRRWVPTSRRRQASAHNSINATQKSPALVDTKNKVYSFLFFWIVTFLCVVRRVF